MVFPTEPRLLPIAEAQQQGLTSTKNQERLESVKAACFSTVAVGLTFALLTVFNQLVASAIPSLWVLQMQGVNLQGAGSGAIALISGYLFGMNYRYTVRTDLNPHLGSGVVMTFGLIRGLAQLDVGLMAQGVIWPFIVLALESVFLFAIARLVLDLVFRLGWVQRSELEPPLN
ncbi:MAG: hypothetical protein ACFCU8_18970 [Thermosynechococcaceae cyanobacterium]